MALHVRGRLRMERGGRMVVAFAPDRPRHNTSERMNGDTDQMPSYFVRLSMRTSPRVHSCARWYKVSPEGPDQAGDNGGEAGEE